MIWSLDLVPERLRGETAAFDIVAGDKVIVEVGRRITAKHIREMEKAGLKELDIPADYLHGKVTAKTILHPVSKELVCECNTIITAEVLTRFVKAGINSFDILYTNEIDKGAFIADTLRADASTRTDLDLSLIHI